MNKLILTPLPYNSDSLEPIISKEIVELHHDKHQAAYVNGANEIIEKNEWNKETMKSFSFHYNGAKLHEIFWENMTSPKQNNQAGGTLMTAISQNFGSYENFVTIFEKAAISVEGSGWAVLWKDDFKNLFVGQLEKHNLLGLNGLKPILVLDVWEHAYYLQYKNDRTSYVKNWWQVVNWEDILKRFEQK